MNSQYVLKYSADEIERLNLQAVSLYDTRLDSVIASARSILDFGCGPGSLVDRILKLNPNAHYLGVDASASAISKAEELFAHRSPHLRFETSDVAGSESLDRFASDKSEKFDLIICRLVLWSLPHVDENYIRVVAQMLKPSGILYAFEPDDKNLTIVPAKPDLEKIISAWQTSVFSRGQNPFIGRQLHSLFVGAGLTNVDAYPMAFTASGQEPEKYQGLMRNLKSIFTTQPDESVKSQLFWKTGLDEFDRTTPIDFVSEHHYSVFGTKP